MNFQKARTIVQQAIHEFHAQGWIRACCKRVSAKESLLNLYAHLGGTPAIDEKDSRLRLELEESHLVLRNDEVAYIVATPSRVVYGSAESLWPVENVSLWPWGTLISAETLEVGILQHIGRFLAPVDIIRAAGTCTRWRGALNDEKVLGWIVRKLTSCLVNNYKYNRETWILTLIERWPPLSYTCSIHRPGLLIQHPSFFANAEPSELCIQMFHTKPGGLVTVEWVHSDQTKVANFTVRDPIPKGYAHLMRNVCLGV